MKRSSYGERDYAFGQRMLRLRSAIGLTQAELGQPLGVSRKAVSRWEAGESYPKAEHLKALLTLALRVSVYPAGREAEEIRTFWQKETRQRANAQQCVRSLRTPVARSSPSQQIRRASNPSSHASN